MKNDSFIAPEWLNNKYVEEILRNYKKDNQLKIVELEVKPATAKGDNYIGVMTRIKACFLLSKSKDTQWESYIVKTTHENNEFVEDLMGDYQVYKTEMKMYEKVLPHLAGILKEIGDEDKLFAETVYVDYEHEAIIFEDLSVLNFVVPDRLAGLDVEHTKLALKKLAKMHATAAVLNERLCGALEKFDRGIVNSHTEKFSSFFCGMFENCANYAGESKELGAYYKEKLLKLKPYVMKYAERAVTPQEGQFNTLNHGDIWTNNFMFRYAHDANTNKKVIQDVILIDFQFCNWGPPGIDLHYLFSTSLQTNLRLYDQDKFIQYYHRVLVKTLKQLNFRGFIPTLHQLSLQLEAGRFYAVTSSLVQFPMMINDKTDDADLHALFSECERGKRFRKLLYTNKVVQENLEILLKIFDYKGLLDVDE